MNGSRKTSNWNKYNKCISIVIYITIYIPTNWFHTFNSVTWEYNAVQ